MTTIATNGTPAGWMFFFTTIGLWGWAMWMGYRGIIASHPPHPEPREMPVHLPADGPVYVGDVA